MNKARILAAQKVMVPLTLIVHLWVVVHGHAADGALWGTLYFVLFVYAELYWAWRSFNEGGFSPFFVCSALAGLWWLFLFAVHYRERRPQQGG
jgi:hypothetical protein